MQLVPNKIHEQLSNLNIKLNFKLTLFESDQLRFFFSAFRLQCYLYLFVAPIGLGVPAYLISTSFDIGSIGIAIGLFLLGVFLLIPWTLLPSLFLFTTFSSNTWQAKASWVYVGLLIVSFILWLLLF